MKVVSGSSYLLKFDRFDSITVDWYLVLAVCARIRDVKEAGRRWTGSAIGNDLR